VRQTESKGAGLYDLSQILMSVMEKWDGVLHLRKRRNQEVVEGFANEGEALGVVGRKKVS